MNFVPNEQDIFDAFGKKGWNLYAFNREEHFIDLIDKGPAEHLHYFKESNFFYFAAPIVKSPRNSLSVVIAYQILSEKNESLRIALDGKKYQFSYIYFYDEFAIFMSHDGLSSVEVKSKSLADIIKNTLDPKCICEVR